MVRVTWAPGRGPIREVALGRPGCLEGDGLLLAQGKPAARQGRKVTGQGAKPDSRTAERSGVLGHPREHGGLPRRRPPCLRGTRGPPSNSQRSSSSSSASFWSPPREKPESWTPPGPLRPPTLTEAPSQICPRISSTTGPPPRPAQDQRSFRLPPRHRLLVPTRR